MTKKGVSLNHHGKHDCPDFEQVTNPPIRMSVFTTMNYLKWYNVAIGGITRSIHAHTGLVFHHMDGREWYWEMNWKGEGGLEGPRQISRLVLWSNRPFRRVRVYDLDLEQKAVYAKWYRVIQLQNELKGYAHNQLLCNMGRSFFGWAIPKDESRMTCSELVSYIIAPEYQCKNKDYPEHDYVSPGRVAEVLEEEGIEPRYI